MREWPRRLSKRQVELSIKAFAPPPPKDEQPLNAPHDASASEVEAERDLFARKVET